MIIIFLIIQGKNVIYDQFQFWKCLFLSLSFVGDFFGIKNNSLSFENRICQIFSQLKLNDLFVKKNENVGRCYVSRVWKCSIWTEKIFALCPLTLSHMYRL